MAIFSSTITDLISNRMPQPYYRCDGIDDNIVASGTTNIVKDSDFAVHVVCRTPTGTGGASVILATKTYSWNTSSGFMIGTENAQVGDGSAYQNFDYSNMPTGEWTDIIVTFDYGSNALTVYLNGIQWYTASLTVGYANSTDNLTFGSWANTSQGIGNVEIASCEIYNYLPSSTERKDMISGNPVPYKYKGASEAGITTSFGTGDTGWSSGGNGSLNYDGSGGIYSGGRLDTQLITPHSHKRFRVTWNATAINIEGGTYFRFRYTNASSGLVYGPSITTTGVGSWEFTAEAVSGTQYLYLLTWHGENEITLTDVRFTLIGAVAEYDGSGATDTKWFDKSGNALHGTVSGATVENAPSDTNPVPYYEEGTWTGAITAGSGTITINSSFNTFGYTKVGRVVHIEGRAKVSAISSPSGELTITGLPFTSVEAAEDASQTAMSFYLRGAATALNSCVGQMGSGTTAITLVENGTTGAGDMADHIDTGSMLMIGGTYLSA